jgi:hypothetical protein
VQVSIHSPERINPQGNQIASGGEVEPPQGGFAPLLPRIHPLPTNGSREGDVLVSDTVLAIKVKRAIQTSEDLAEEDVRVHVHDGIVTLEGTVQSERLKHLTETLAESVHGVDEIDNRLRVV